MEYHFTKIDLNRWSRGKLFCTYIDHMRIVMSLTVELDVTHLLEFSKANGLKFYPCMIWAVSKIINAHDEFKYGWGPDGGLIRWDFVSPSYADFHKEDESFTKLVTGYSPDLLDFHARFLADRKSYRDCRSFAERQPPNFFDVSCLPWVRYQHFDVHVFDEGTFLAPVVTWGKYTPEHGRYQMPVSMNIHHAVADGFHLSRFFIELQELVRAFPGAQI